MTVSNTRYTYAMSWSKNLLFLDLVENVTDINFEINAQETITTKNKPSSLWFEEIQWNEMK